MTQSYYDAHAKEYAELTVKADMSPAYDRFLAYLPAGAGILDAGCGSGRDSLCFMKKGYDVTMLDASEGMCNCAEELTGQKALCMGFHEIEFADRHCIWPLMRLILKTGLTESGPVRLCFTFRKKNWNQCLQNFIVRYVPAVFCMRHGNMAKQTARMANAFTAI